MRDQLIFWSLLLIIIFFADMFLTQVNLDNGRTDANFIVRWIHNISPAYGLMFFSVFKAGIVIKTTAHYLNKDADSQRNIIMIYLVFFMVHVVLGIGSNFVALWVDK